jgi:hypothetical protein
MNLDLAIPTGAQDRVCVICGGSLKHRRKDASCCSGACRAERSRVRAILSGKSAGPYDSLAGRISAKQRRTKAHLSGHDAIRDTVAVQARRTDNDRDPDGR